MGGFLLHMFLKVPNSVPQTLFPNSFSNFLSHLLCPKVLLPPKPIMSKAQRTRWPTTIRTRNPTLKPNQMKQYPPQEAQVNFPLWIGRDMGIGMRFFGGGPLIFSIVFCDVPQILLMFLNSTALAPMRFSPKFSSCNLYRVAQYKGEDYNISILGVCLWHFLLVMDQ